MKPIKPKGPMKPMALSASIYLFKVNNRSTGKMCKICSQSKTITL